MEKFQTKKKFGQNFLTDKNLLSAICSDAEITKEDEVLEIGAGRGTLTEELSKVAKKVVSFEIDKDLTEILLSKKLPNVEFKFDDIMKKDLEEIEKSFSGKYKIVANLPYYITTPIIFKFLEGSNRVKSMTIMVQKEVAERMIAKEGGKEYGVLSVSIASYGGAIITRNVGRNMFSPPPKVDSAVVRIDIKNQYEIKDLPMFFEFVRKCFAMRRKTLLNNLSIGYSLAKGELVKILDENILSKRAENFTVQEIIKIYDKFKNK